MKVLIKKSVLVCPILLSLFGCLEDRDTVVNTDYKTKYEAQVEETNSYRAKYLAQILETNDYIDKSNARLDDSQKTSELLMGVMSLMDELDEKALKCLKLNSDIQEKLLKRESFGLHDLMQELNTCAQSARDSILQMELKISRDVKAQLIDNVSQNIKEDSRTSTIARIKQKTDALEVLSGWRDLFLNIYNELVGPVNALIAPNATDARTVPTLRTEEQTPSAPREVNPIVTDMTEGGRITGVVRDSVSGRPLEGATVGFKILPTSTNYFYTTRTNATGSYESPYLRQGSYYIDITADGHIVNRNMEVRVVRGQRAEETVSMSTPIAESQYRITISWTREKVQAVRDVDSYLQIPGAPTPLSYRSVARPYFGAFLDRDDIDWVGPETVTISEVKQGTYIYYVNNFSERHLMNALGDSEIRVRVYKGNEHIRDFDVPKGRGLSYEIFRIENGVFKATGVWNDSLVMH